MRQTYTYALLEVSPAAHREIESKLRAAGYDHALHEDGVIDMHGIALVVSEEDQVAEMEAAGPSNEELLKFAETHRPPQSWYDEGGDESGPAGR